MIKLKIKKYKWFFISITTFLLLISFFRFKKLFEKTDLYQVLSGRSISIEEIMNSNAELGFYNLSEFGGEGVGLRLRRKNDDNKLITDFDYLTQFQNFNYLHYGLRYAPKNISEILNKLPNIKVLNVWHGTILDLSYFKDLKYIEELEVSGGKLSELGTALNTSPKIKNIRWYCDYDNQDFSISNITLEKLMFNLDFYEKFSSMDNTNLKLDTPNLKLLELKTWDLDENNSPVPLTIVIDNENRGTEAFNLDRIHIQNIRTPQIEALGDPIKTRELIVLKPFLGSIDLGYFLRSIRTDTLEKFVLIDDSLELTNIEYLDNLQNVTELALSVISMKDLKGLTNMQNLQKLYLGSINLENIDNIDTLSNLHSLGLYGSNVNDYSPLNNLKNLKELIVPYSALEKLPDLEGLESLVLILEPKDDYKIDEPIELNGRFKNVNISFGSSVYLYWGYRIEN